MSRLLRELTMLAEDPPPGVSAWPVSEAKADHLHARKCVLSKTSRQTETEAKDRERDRDWHAGSVPGATLRLTIRPRSTLEIQGPEDTPYEAGTFLLELDVPLRSVRPQSPRAGDYW